MAIFVDGEICKGCQLCIHFCPKKVFEVGEEVNYKGFIIPKIAHKDQCIKCKICELICPDLAIFVER